MVRLTAALLLVASVASAHQAADIRMLFDVPKFVPTSQSFRYRVIADDVSNDEGAGVTVTIVLPPQVRFAGIAQAVAWHCSQNNLTITCEAEDSTSARMQSTST